MEKIIYSKYSNDRRREFAIRTDICCDNRGVKKVYKTAMFPEGKQHLEHMHDYYINMKTDVELAECNLKADGRLEFEYLEGTPLDEILDDLLLKGEKEKLEEVLLKYIRNIYEKSCDCDFFVSQPFKEIFGDVELPGTLKCARFTNIDMILSNVLRHGRQEKLIDYEWAFDFPIPAHYVAFRVLHYYIYSNSHREILADRNLYEKAEISDEEIEEYMKMENHFQQFILNGRAKFHQLYTMITPGIEAVVDKQNGIQEDCFLKPNRLLHVFFSQNDTFSEEASQYYKFEKDGTMCVRIPINTEIKKLRIDPGEIPCVLDVVSMKLNGKEVQTGVLDGNWRMRTKQKFFFATSDPQIILYMDTAGELELQLHNMDISQGAAELIGKQLELRDRKINVIRKELEETKRLLHAIENTKTWKMHEKCSQIFVKKGKSNE